jgi:hypothetical protein
MIGWRKATQMTMRAIASRVLTTGITVALVAGLAGCTQPTVTIEVVTHAHDYQPVRLVASAGQSAKVTYRNQEEWAEHNIAVYAAQGGELIARSENIVGPDGVTELNLQPLVSGTYFV